MSGLPGQIDDVGSPRRYCEFPLSPEDGPRARQWLADLFHSPIGEFASERRIYLTGTATYGSYISNFNIQAPRPRVFSYWWGTTMTSLSVQDRRKPYSEMNEISRALQKQKNGAAVDLLKSWLSEQKDSEAESSSLEGTISSLNHTRATSRRLFP